MAPTPKNTSRRRTQHVRDKVRAIAAGILITAAVGTTYILHKHDAIDIPAFMRLSMPFWNDAKKQQESALNPNNGMYIILTPHDQKEAKARVVNKITTELRRERIATQSDGRTDTNNRGTQRVYAKYNSGNELERIIGLATRHTPTISMKILERIGSKEYDITAELPSTALKQSIGKGTNKGPFPYYPLVRAEIIRRARSYGITSFKDINSITTHYGSILQHESSFNANAEGPSDDHGLGQVRPSTALLIDWGDIKTRAMMKQPKKYNAELAKYRRRLHDPTTNIQYSVALYLNEVAHFRKEMDLEDALSRADAAYNGGREDAIDYDTMQWNTTRSAQRKYDRISTYVRRVTRDVPKYELRVDAFYDRGHDISKESR